MANVKIVTYNCSIYLTSIIIATYPFDKGE